MGHEERRKSLKELIIGVGGDLNRLPPYDELCGVYGVSKGMISQDVHSILKDIKDEERGKIGSFLDEIYYSYKQVEKVARHHVYNQDPSISLKACNTWLQWSNNFLDNLERLGYRDESDKPEPQKLELIWVKEAVDLQGFIQWCIRHQYREVWRALAEYTSEIQGGESLFRNWTGGKISIDDFKQALEQKAVKEEK